MRRWRSACASLETLAFRNAPCVSPRPEEVEIDVRAVGLDFIEVLYALGMLPEMPDGRFTFGLECAGIVVRTGTAVHGLKPGDEVMAFANGAARLRLVAPARCVARVPGGLTLDQAATMPAAYMTAYTALVEEGRLRAGERVLVHSACGGVGLAAINVARWIGAEVLATAGTDEKRAHLRAMGISTVMDSRSAAFADETRRSTGGAGVDVVLNSLGGEFIDLGMSTLGPRGRFLELGKRDIFEGTPLSLRHFARQLSFIAIDVGPDLPRFESIWSAVQQRIVAGDFPPLPHRTVAATDAASAFAEMARGRHIGKFVLSLADRAAALEQARRTRGPQRSDLPLDEILGPPPLHATSSTTLDKQLDTRLAHGSASRTCRRAGARLTLRRRSRRASKRRSVHSGKTFSARRPLDETMTSSR